MTQFGMLSLIGELGSNTLYMLCLIQVILMLYFLGDVVCGWVLHE